MLSYPITQEQLEIIASALKIGAKKEQAQGIVNSILESLKKSDIEKTVGIITEDGIVIKENIMEILEDQKWTMGDIPESIAIGKAVKNIIGNIAETKAELKDIDMNEITILLSSTLQTINTQVK